MPRGLAGGPPFDLSVPHHIVGAPSFAESTLLFLALGAKGWAYNDPPCQSGCSGFMPAASNTSSPAVAIIARDYGFNDPTLCCAKEWGTHSFVRIEIEIGKGGPPALSHGNDCNGGPCTPFMYVDANGCTNFVAFAPVKGPDGQTFDYPYIAGQICSGTSAVNTAGSGDGGGSGISGLLNKISSVVCKAVPDVVTAGGGADLSFIFGQGVQVGLAANGNSGQLGITITHSFQAGLAGPDAYVYGGIVWNAKDNSALGGQWQHPMTNFTNFGQLSILKNGIMVDEHGNITGTFGPSLFPVQVSGGVSRTGVLGNIPFLGYLLNPNRTLCKSIT